ncbi:glycosyltransferase family 2 protein [Romboutsia sp.]|uniref:glycosyltransferase family 2 protein n=1 Tax=Romboutsia sp. TaxID=1965302 RepID=UPI003F39FF8D
MNNKKISVIVPVYNVEKYLERCLNSLLNQTYKNLEIILINDGSTDSSEEIRKKYSKQDEKIKFISQENKGIAETRNVGIKNSTGEYIAFLDSDDCSKASH